MTVARIACVPLATALLCACYGGPGTDSPVVGRRFPPGVSAAPPAPTPSGLYAAPMFGAYNCCWMTKHTTFATMIPAGRTKLRVMVSLPAYGPFDARPQTLAIGIDGGKPETFANLRSGIYALDVPVAARARSRDAIVSVTSSYAWMPKGDTRHRSVQLRAVRAL